MVCLDLHSLPTTLAHMHRCRSQSDLSPEHIRVIRHALTWGLDDTPSCNLYVAGSAEFDLLEEMVQMGLMKFQRTALRYRCYSATGRAAARVGLYVPTLETIRGRLAPCRSPDVSSSPLGRT